MSKLLFIQYKPYTGSVMNGGDQCTKRNYDMLCRVLGAENIEVLYIHEADNKRSLKSYIEGVLYMPFGYFFGLTPARARRIVQKAQAFDFVFIDRSVFGIIARKLKDKGYAGKIISHFHNFETAYFDAKIKKYIPFRRVLLHCVKRNDRYACLCSDSVIALNQRDAELLQSHFGKTPDTLIPISMTDRCEDTPEDDTFTSVPPRCLFLGAYFPANTEGIIWFMRHVVPHVHVEIKIVGKGMGRLKSDCPALLKDIEIVSDAPDLEPWFQWADVMVLPIFSGSGMKVKTCESLMHGKNIIGSDEAFEGYEIKEGVSGWRCNTEEEFIACINDFAANPRPHYNKEARRLYMDNYSEASVFARFAKLCNR